MTWQPSQILNVQKGSYTTEVVAILLFLTVSMYVAFEFVLLPAIADKQANFSWAASLPI